VLGGGGLNVRADGSYIYGCLSKSVCLTAVKIINADVIS
jgi:hypothetical protein